MSVTFFTIPVKKIIFTDVFKGYNLFSGPVFFFAIFIIKRPFYFLRVFYVAATLKHSENLISLPCIANESDAVNFEKT